MVYGFLSFRGLSGGDSFYADIRETVSFEPFFEFCFEVCGNIVSGDFPEIHYLVVGSAGRATFVQFVEEEIPVKGYVYIFTEAVHEIPAFTEAGAAFEVHIWSCRQFKHLSTAVTHQSFSTDSGVMFFQEDTWSRM